MGLRVGIWVFNYVKESLLETLIPGKRELLRRNPFSLLLGILSNNDVMLGALAAILGHERTHCQCTEKQKAPGLLRKTPSHCSSLSNLSFKYESEHRVGIRHSQIPDIFLIIPWYFGSFTWVLSSYIRNPKTYLSAFLIARLRTCARVLSMWSTHIGLVFGKEKWKNNQMQESQYIFFFFLDVTQKAPVKSRHPGSYTVGTGLV